MRKVLIIDTSILCVWLDIPGMDTSGSDNDQWNKLRVDQKINDEEEKGTTFVLPLATIIETGNHIAQRGNRFNKANELADLMTKSAESISPWAAFSEQNDLWSIEKIKLLAETWPTLATDGTSLGDATIKDVAEYYSQSGFDVEILTGDVGLKAYEPLTTPEQPRRRR